MRHTKIIATVGPASESQAVIDALLVAGVDVFRLNFSHGTHESHAASYRAIRDASRRAGRHVAVMQDLSGPKIRTGSASGRTASSAARRRRAPHHGRRLRGRPGRDLDGVRRARALGPCRRSTAARRRTDRAACGRHLPNRVDDRRCYRWSARRAQGHQCAGRAFAYLVCHGEGCGRSAFRPRARRGLRGLELRADGRRRHAGEGRDDGSRTLGADHRQDRAAGGRRQP